MEHGQPDLRERIYLTVAEAAAELEVSRTTVWRWIGEGRLTGYRVGGRTIRIRKEDLRAALKPVQAPRKEEMIAVKERIDVRVAGDDIWAGYDPARVKVALRKSAGALATVDRRTLLKDLRKGRKQDSRGRPA